MQNLSVISINIWDVLISLCNLMLLTWVVKKFLFKRVQKVIADRRAAIDADYAQAKEAREHAEEDRRKHPGRLNIAETRLSPRRGTRRTTSAGRRRPTPCWNARRRKTTCGARLRTFPPS